MARMSARAEEKNLFQYDDDDDDGTNFSLLERRKLSQVEEGKGKNSSAAILQCQYSSRRLLE